MTKPKVIVLVFLALATITGCTSNESAAEVEPNSATNIEKSVFMCLSAPTSDINSLDRFHLRFEFGVNNDILIDTKEQILRVKVSSDITTHVSDFQLNEKDMSLIYEEAISQGLLREQDKVEESVTCNKKPHENYKLTLYHESSTFHYEWNECDKDKQNLTNLKDVIMNTLQKNETYIQLKEDMRYAE